MVADTETANGPQTFAECSDDEIHTIFHAGFLGQPATAITKDSQRVSLINHQVGTILLLHGDNVRQRGAIPHHTVKTLGNNQHICIALFKTA